MSGILSEMVDDLKDLVDRDVSHNAKAHETLIGCEGCRRIEVVLLIRDYLRFEEDDKPQDQLGGLSQKEVQRPKIEASWEANKAQKAQSDELRAQFVPLKR